MVPARGAAIAVMALTTSCSIALAYPATQPEVGPVLCHDGVDNDLDGRVDCAERSCGPSCPEICTGGIDEDGDGRTDCADPACDGSPDCPEETAERCSDGRDNDLDGRIDARDAACWPFATSTFTRCASVLHTSIDARATDLVGGTLVTDPFGTGATEPWIRVPNDPAHGVASPPPSTGALEGLHATVAFDFDNPLASPGHAASLPNVAVDLVVPSSTRAPALVAEVGLTGAFLFAGDTNASLVRTRVPPDERAHLHATLDIAITDGNLNAVLSVDGVAPVSVSSRLSVMWPDAPAISLHVTAFATGPGQVVYVERAAIARMDLHRCGTVEPPLGIVDLGSSETANVALTALVRGRDRTLCGVVYMPERGGALRPYALASNDDGVTFTRGATLVRPHFPVGATAPAADSPAIRVAYDPVAHDFVAAALVDTIGTGRAVDVTRSADCVTWDHPLVAIDDATDGGSLALGAIAGPSGYLANEAGHTLVLIAYAGPDMHAMLVPWTSSWGDPGTWTEGTHDPSVAAFLPPLSPVAMMQSRPMWLGDLGAPLIASSSAGGAPRVLHTTGWREAPAALLTPSDEAGAFDATDVQPIAFLEDACTDADADRHDVFCGRMFYTGLYDAPSAAGFGHANVRIAPSTRP
jgi:hypothetical protein